MRQILFYSCTYFLYVVCLKGAKIPPTKGTIPENPETLHPVTLVGRVFPGTIFYELSREGTPPHLTFQMGTTVNDIQHVGVGEYKLFSYFFCCNYTLLDDVILLLVIIVFYFAARSKKEAKKNCAIEVLKANNIPYNTNA